MRDDGLENGMALAFDGIVNLSIRWMDGKIGRLVGMG
jgi:hypothetical protein